MKDDEDEWVQPDMSEPERLLPLLKQYPDTEMDAYPVSTAVKRNVDKTIICWDDRVIHLPLPCVRA